MRQSASNNNNTRIETTIWNTKDLAEGATLEGIYKASGIVNTKFGESNRYIIVDPAGAGWAVFGSASLDRQFKRIPEGSYVWITYKGTEVSKNGFTVKVYDVDFDDEYNQ